MKLYLDAEEITDVNKKKNKLLHLGGPQLQEIAFGLPGAVLEYDPIIKNDVFELLVSALDNHFSPQQNSSFERHVFRHMTVENGENLNKFLLRCRAQANKCSFGNNENEARDINLKDKLIDMWAPIELRRKLLERELPLDQVIEQCLIYEQTQTQSSLMQKQETQQADGTETYINRIENKDNKKRSWETSTNKCSRCGYYHEFNDLNLCPAHNTKCHQCGRMGHYARRCRTMKSKRMTTSSTVTRGQRQYFPRRVNQVTEDNEEETTSSTDIRNLECFKVGEPDHTTRDDTILVKVGGVTINMLKLIQELRVI